MSKLQLKILSNVILIRMTWYTNVFLCFYENVITQLKEANLQFDRYQCFFDSFFEKFEFSY